MKESSSVTHTNNQRLVYPTSPDTSIKEGDFVRSYDFHDKTNCYVEGHIACLDKARYTIKVNKVVFQNVELDVDSTTKWAYPPVNGTSSLFGSPTCGVQLIRRFKGNL